MCLDAELLQLLFFLHVPSMDVLYSHKSNDWVCVYMYLPVHIFNEQVIQVNILYVNNKLRNDVTEYEINRFYLSKSNYLSYVVE